MQDGVVRLRECRDGDAADIVAWRNESRRWFFNDDEISIDIHRRFRLAGLATISL